MVGFIHIPKTAGSYVVGQTRVRRHEAKTPQGNAVTPLINFGHTAIVARAREPNYLHYPVEASRVHWYSTHMKDFAQKMSLCTNVRNPYSWLVSYNYAVTVGKIPHPDREVANRSFKEFIKALSEREGRWPWKKLLFFQMFCSDGEMIVDWINRQECLDEDLERMARNYGLEYKKKESVNAYPHKDYREHYDDETIEIVSKTWARELGLFGYSFEGLTGKPLVKQYNVMKDIIKYDMGKDLLTINGRKYDG